MEKGLKIGLGLLGLAVVIGGGVWVYKKVNLPQLISFDSKNKKFVYKWNGKNLQDFFVKDQNSLALGTSGYYIEPRFENNKIVGAYLKNKTGGIIDSI